MDKTDKPRVDNIPSRLYKYRCWSDAHHRRMLTDNAVWFSSARGFNDPFDCRIPLNPGPISDEKAKERIEVHMREDNPTVSRGEIEIEIKRLMAIRPWRNPANLKRVIDMHQESKFAQGFFTVSSTRTSILMWSHYSDAHKGFCVGFDTVKMRSFFRALFDGDGTLVDLLKVDYQDEYPDISFYGVDELEAFYKPLVTKSSKWKYEEEFRFHLMDKANIQFALDNGIIVEVIFGCEMQEGHKSEIKDVLREKGGMIELFEARMKEKSFGLDFIPVDY